MATLSAVGSEFKIKQAKNALHGLYAVALVNRENALHAQGLLLASEVNYWLFA
jgi:hypothetical protein